MSNAARSISAWRFARRVFFVVHPPGEAQHAVVASVLNAGGLRTLYETPWNLFVYRRSAAVPRSGQRAS